MNYVCRLCLEAIEDSMYNFVDEYVVSSRKKVLLFMPELDVDLVSNPVFCFQCCDFIQKMYEFRSKCLQTEDKINNYIENNNGLKPIDLVQVLEIVDSKNLILKEIQSMAVTDPLLNNINCEIQDLNKGIFSANTELIGSALLENKLTESETSDSKYQSDPLACYINDYIDEEQAEGLTSISDFDFISIKTECEDTAISHTVTNEKDKTAKKQSKYKYSCKFCTKKFILNSAMKWHVNMHFKKTDISCQICNLFFKTEKLLQKHLRLHRDGDLETDTSSAHTSISELYKCKVCNKICKCSTSLHNHTQIHKVDKEFICKICNKGFILPSYLRKHMKIHFDNKPFKCLQCGIAFVAKSALRDHSRTHTGERPFKCETCGKSFAQSSTLRTHMRCVHATERPYACEVCSKTFTLKTSLHKHSLVHTDHVEKTYDCPVCTKQFKRLSDMKRHHKRHIGNASHTHTCIICKKGFFGATALNIHMRHHTDERPFECHICQKKCSQKYNLLIHLKSHDLKNE